MLSQSFTYLLNGNEHIYIGFGTLKVRCTQYVICGQVAFKNTRVMVFSKSGGRVVIFHRRVPKNLDFLNRWLPLTEYSSPKKVHGRGTQHPPFSPTQWITLRKLHESLASNNHTSGASRNGTSHYNLPKWYQKKLKQKQKTNDDIQSNTGKRSQFVYIIRSSWIMTVDSNFFHVEDCAGSSPRWILHKLMNLLSSQLEWIGGLSHKSIWL